MDPKFKEFAANYVLFCHVTSRVESDPYQNLLGEKGGSGFPYLAFMDADGNVLAKHQGQRTAEGFAQTGEKAQAFLALKARAATGDKDAQYEYLVAQLELGHLSREQASSRIAGLGDIPAERKERLEGLLLDLEIGAVLATVTQDKATQIDAGKKFREMMKAGKVPGDPSSREWMTYLNLVMIYAESATDVEAFQEAYDLFQKHHGDNPRLKAFLENQAAALEKMKGGEEEEDDEEEED